MMKAFMIKSKRLTAKALAAVMIITSMSVPVYAVDMAEVAGGTEDNISTAIDADYESDAAIGP